MRLAFNLEMPERLSLPVVPLRDTVMFPELAAPLTVGRMKTLRAVESTLTKSPEDRRVFAVAQRDSAEEPTADGLYAVGVIARIAQVKRLGAGLEVIVLCEARAAALRYQESEGIIEATVMRLDDTPPRSIEAAAVASLCREVREQTLAYGRRRGAPEDVLRQFVATLDDPGALANHVAFYVDLSTQDKQELLETLGIEQRLRTLAAYLGRHLRTGEAERVRSLSDELEDRQRELFLREQLRAIQKELGDEDEAGGVDRLEARLLRLELPAEVLIEVRRDLGRMRRLGRESSPEMQVVTTWLETIAELPWNERSEDSLDLAEAARILDADHHGLADVKERVLEHLSVRKLRADRSLALGVRERAFSRGPILLFAGPPGVGKTSIAESIARALGRRYVRVSLGGARDEADIRGHRRTYVGAMLGRILKGMRRAGTKNPVFTLDEVDKLTASYHGDPAAALLEVLDPAQNSAFVDHYLGVPFDLSEVLFVCTANHEEAIPAALRDRMETLRFAGYTENEKLEIAKRYLVPRQRDDGGLELAELALGEGALRELVAGYTREAGVRQLERAIASIVRKAARRIASGDASAIAIDDEADVRELLGRPSIRRERPLERETPGVATGMFYTEAGGDIMLVEACVTSGRAELVLTGQLGEVMRESGRAALTYARAYAERFGVAGARLVDRGYHVHVPAGAVPKDGPSAGVTIATALVSAITGLPVRADLAMTGEISLRGRVLPIGGVKEKVLGAHRAGIPEIVLPRDNEGDLDDLPDEVRRSVSFHLVETLDEVLALALRAEPEAERETPTLTHPRAA